MQPRKQHLIDTALLLFNQYGYHATGIDLILAKSGVSKATLYKHYRSKDELILAVLQQRHEQVLTMLSSKIDEAPKVEVARVSALFEALHSWFNSDSFFGCNFINASAEYADANNPIHIMSAQHKQAITDLIRAKIVNKESDLAEQISLLAEGAIVMAHTQGMKNAALMAKKMACQLIIES